MARTKTVAFFHLMYDSPQQEVLNTNWVPLLESVARLNEDQRTVYAKGAAFFVEVADASRGHLLVHRVKDLDEWLKIRSEGGVRDLRDEIQGDVLETSAVALQRRNSVFALVRGSAAAPGHGQVAYVLSQLTSGPRLAASAITVSAQLDRLASAQSMSRFDIKVTGDPTWVPPNHGVMRTMRDLRQATGPEVTIGIEVSVGHKRDHQLLGRVRELFGATLGALPEGSRGEATIFNEEGEREIINLVEHKLAMTVELPGQGLAIEHVFGAMDALADSHAGEIRRSLASVAQA